MNLDQLKQLGHLDQLKTNGLVTPDEYSAIRERITALAPPPPVSSDPIATKPQPIPLRTVLIFTAIAVAMIMSVAVYNGRRQKEAYELKKAEEQKQSAVESIDNQKADSVAAAKRSVNTEQLVSEARKTVASLKPVLRYKKDDFNGGWYEPKSAPKYINQNGFYAYFNYKDDAVGPGSIWWTLQYHADDWLFIESYIFLIDGQQYTFTPTDPKRDSGNGGMIWEWFNEEAKANSQALEILNLLAKAKSAKVRIIGKDYRKDVNISELQRIEINRILKLHAALTTIHNS